MRMRERIRFSETQPGDQVRFEKIELHAARNGANGSRVADVASCNCSNESRFNRKINWYRSRPFPQGDIIKFFLSVANDPFFFLGAGRVSGLSVHRGNRNQWRINWRNITVKRVLFSLVRFASVRSTSVRFDIDLIQSAPNFCNATVSNKKTIRYFDSITNSVGFWNIPLCHKCVINILS